MTGGHLEISDDDMKKYIVPYLLDEEAEAPQNPILIESESDSDATSFLSRKHSGQQDLQLNINILHRL